MNEPTTSAVSAALAKASGPATFAGSGAAVMFGLSQGEWQILGIVGGILVGLFGLAANVVFKVLHYRLARRQGNADAEA